MGPLLSVWETAFVVVDFIYFVWNVCVWLELRGQAELVPPFIMWVLRFELRSSSGTFTC